MIVSRTKNNITTKIKTFLIHTYTFYKPTNLQTLSKLLFRKCQIVICVNSNHRDSRDPPKLKIFFILFPVRVFQCLPLDSLYFVSLYHHFSYLEPNPVNSTMSKALFIYDDNSMQNCEVCIPTLLYILFFRTNFHQTACVEYAWLAQLVVAYVSKTK